MPKAKKLPSGAWNCSVYSHTENGKRVYVSFTAQTKSEAELKAAEFKADKKRIVRHDLTVRQVIDGYIEAKEAVLSPSTIAGYCKMLHHYDSIGNKKIRTLTSEDLQRYVSDLSISGLSPKTIKNIYSLLTSSIALYSPDLHFRVTLPAKKKKRPSSPSDEAVQALFDNASFNLKKAIGFGCLGLREGEVSALLYEDINDGWIHVSKDMVQDRHGEWIVKEVPKTEDSDRMVKLPPYLIDLIGTGTGRIVPILPNTIGKEFIKLRNKMGINIRFHDLRHFFCSTAAILQIPDIYTADMGGWSRSGNSTVMKTVYQNNIKSMSDYYADKMAAHMGNIFESCKMKCKTEN